MRDDWPLLLHVLWKLAIWLAGPRKEKFICGNGPTFSFCARCAFVSLPLTPAFQPDSLLTTRNGEGVAWDEVACRIVGEGRELSIWRSQEATSVPSESMAMKEEQGTKKQFDYTPTIDPGCHYLSVPACTALLVDVDSGIPFCLQAATYSIRYWFSRRYRWTLVQPFRTGFE